eukprot:gene11752-15725_t
MASENLPPQIISRLMGEIRDLIKNPVDGIEYQENEDGNSSVSEIFAIISGPEETPFHGGRFRMKLVLSEDYPNSPPKGYFLTRIFHPNIANNGDICVNTLKKDWTPEVTIKHILQIIRCLLIVPFPESSLNDEAGKMFMDSYEEFFTRARIMTEVHALPSETETKNSKLGVDIPITLSSDMVMTSSNEANQIQSIQTQKKNKEKDLKKKSLKRL